MNDTSEAERVFNEVSKDGRILMPLKWWWDRFGIQSLINRYGSDGPAHIQTVQASPLSNASSSA